MSSISSISCMAMLSRVGAFWSIKSRALLQVSLASLRVVRLFESFLRTSSASFREHFNLRKMAAWGLDPNRELVLEKTEPLGDELSSEGAGVPGGSGALGFGFFFSGELFATNLTLFFFGLCFVFLVTAGDAGGKVASLSRGTSEASEYSSCSSSEVSSVTASALALDLPVRRLEVATALSISSSSLIAPEEILSMFVSALFRDSFIFSSSCKCLATMASFSAKLTFFKYKLALFSTSSSETCRV